MFLLLLQGTLFVCLSCRFDFYIIIPLQLSDASMIITYIIFTIYKADGGGSEWYAYAQGQGLRREQGHKQRHKEKV